MGSSSLSRAQQHPARTAGRRSLCAPESSSLSLPRGISCRTGDARRRGHRRPPSRSEKLFIHLFPSPRLSYTTQLLFKNGWMAAFVAEQAQRGGLLFLGRARLATWRCREEQGGGGDSLAAGMRGQAMSAARCLSSSQLPFSPAASPGSLLLLSCSLPTPPACLWVPLAGRQPNAF